MTIYIDGAPSGLDKINVLYNNVFEDGTVTWANQVTGSEALNVLDDESTSWWTQSSVPSWVKVALPAVDTVNCLGIASHDMGTSGASFELQHSPDGVTWTSIYGPESPTNDDDIIVYFDDVTDDYFRVIIDDAVCNIGVIKLGSRLAFPVAPMSGHKPLHHSRSVTLLSNQTVGGQLRANRPVKMGAGTTVNCGLVDRSFTEGALLPFEDAYNNGRAFFYCGAPSVIPKDMGYCWRPEGGDIMNVSWSEGDGLSQVDFEIRALVNV